MKVLYNIMRKNTSIRIDEKTWEDFRIYCIKNKTDCSTELEKFLEELLYKKK